MDADAKNTTAQTWSARIAARQANGQPILNSAGVRYRKFGRKLTSPIGLNQSGFEEFYL
jgi:hypothetical protein